MNNQNAYGVKRLESKTAREAIIQKIASDFNLRHTTNRSALTLINMPMSNCLLDKSATKLSLLMNLLVST